MDKIITVGIDPAKRLFALHAVDAAGRVVFRKTLRREQLVARNRGQTLRSQAEDGVWFLQVAP